MKFPIHMHDLGAFVAELRSEGFDARTDLFNGQVGLIVGPTGLDRARMPPETAGLFLPLWELNYTPNRPLVQARRFHDIHENRPSDWQFNRPYQRTADHVRLELRHWNRSASLMDGQQEERLQSDLVQQFPPSEFPVNIDVISAPDQTFATVHITNPESAIDETARAVPEDFLGAGGLRAAMLAATQTLISKLQQRRRIPATVRQQQTGKAAALELRPIERVGEGPDMSKWDEVFQYEVLGLPPHEQAWIANFGGPYHHEWRILRAINGVQSDWSGNYTSPEAALFALKSDLDTRMKHIETLKGIGTVTSSQGQPEPVNYELHIYQQEVPAATLDDPHATIPGLKEIRGRIDPVCFFGENGLTLEMQDGRKLQFFFTSSEGSIALNRWIG